MTVPKPFNLSIEKRIQERQAFQEVQDQRQKEAEERERLNQEEREREEKKSLKEYRKSLEFKVCSSSQGSMNVHGIEGTIPTQS